MSTYNEIINESPSLHVKRAKHLSGHNLVNTSRMFGQLLLITVCIGRSNITKSKFKKIVSGSNKYSSNVIQKVYSSIIKAGTYLASSIEVAEAAKVIENTQRDLNIALMNELSIIFIDMNSVTIHILPFK